MTRCAFPIVFIAVHTILVWTSACTRTPERVLRAGAHAVDVTPRTFPVVMNCMFLPRIAKEANDPLHARALVLDDGANRIAITVVDNCMMSRELLDGAKQTAERTTGIPSEQMLIAATHTHSAPAAMGCLGTDADADYQRFLTDRIAEAIEGAVKNLRPASIGWAVTKAPEYTHCRRWIRRPDRMREDPFGELTVRASNGAGFQNPDVVGPAGPVDPDLSILSVRSTSGQPIALLANYSMHYVVGAKSVTADYFGQFSEQMKRLITPVKVDPPFVGIMSQGTSGDLGWQDPSKPRQETTIHDYANAIAQVAYRTYRQIQYHDWMPIAMSEAKLELSRRIPTQKRLAWAKSLMAKMNGRPPANLPEIYAREQLLLDEEPSRELKLQALRLGNLGITAIPNEVYAITGLKIKAQSPLHPTFNIELANGSEGYIPPPEQHKLGGYTTWEARTAALEVSAESKIVNTLLERLEEVSGRQRRIVEEEHGSYSQAVLASEPLLYLRLDEFQGSQALDETGHDHHGAYEDGIALYLEGPFASGFSGKTPMNRAVHLAGGRIIVDLEYIPDPYTIEMWFHNGLPVDARSTTGYLFSLGPDSSDGKSHDSLGIGGTAGALGKLVFTHGASEEWIEGTTDIGVKTWNFVAIVRDGNKVVVYLNGNSTPEITFVRPHESFASSGKLFIGGRSDSVANFEGKLDEVAVYDRALLAGEIAAHFSASGEKSDRKSVAFKAASKVISGPDANPSDSARLRLQ